MNGFFDWPAYGMKSFTLHPREGVSAKTPRAENSLFFAFCLPSRHMEVGVRESRDGRWSQEADWPRDGKSIVRASEAGRSRSSDGRYGTRGRDSHFELAAPGEQSRNHDVRRDDLGVACVKRMPGQADARTGSGTERAAGPVVVPRTPGVLSGGDRGRGVGLRQSVGRYQ
jgi:hypothetical protein